MGITIKELNLSLHIGENDSGDKEKDTVEAGQTSLDADCCTNEKQHDAMVSDTVRQVLEILKEQQER